MATLSYPLPRATSPELHLTQATEQERTDLWHSNSIEWAGALSTFDYVQREISLLNALQAQGKRTSYWVLVDGAFHANPRRILASCQTIQKQAFLAEEGRVCEVTVHAITNVFCDTRYRGKGYASRMLLELQRVLGGGQSTLDDRTSTTSPFTILYSDLGKEFYARLGWHPFSSKELVLPAKSTYGDDAIGSTPLYNYHLADLCEIDTCQIRLALERQSTDCVHMALVPDLATIRWHHTRESFICYRTSGRIPVVRGAISGQPGRRIWAIWTRTIHGPYKPSSGNRLSVLRLVTEYEDVTQEAIQCMRQVLLMAMQEAARWDMSEVDLWNPSSLIQRLIHSTGLAYQEQERKLESIPSVAWLNQKGAESSPNPSNTKWMCNEKYGWC
jgi:hypothetical protein